MFVSIMFNIHGLV